MNETSLDAGRCLVARRGQGMSSPGKWEFPGGKVEPGERPEAALAREIREELGAAVRVGDWLGRGEAIAGSRRIVLDVFAAESESAEAFHPAEHSELRWLEASALGELDWAEADIPVLPAVKARMRADPAASCVTRGVAILAADWGKTASKRAVCSALPGAAGWRMDCEEPPKAGWSLGQLVRRAGEIRDACGVPVLVAIDAALGFPERYVRATGQASFVEALLWLAERGGLEEEWSEGQPGVPTAWQPERPFFRVPPGTGALTRFVDAAGGRSMVLRQIEGRAGAKPVFVLSGIPGTVGSGSRELFKELVPMLRSEQAPLKLWPFDGTLAELTASAQIVLAEAYPRSAYAVALGASAPFSPLSLAKSRERVRREALDKLLGEAWICENAVDVGRSGVAAAQEREDEFDALLLAAGLLRASLEGLPLSHELVDDLAEGAIAGTGGVTLEAPRSLRPSNHSPRSRST